MCYNIRPQPRNLIIPPKGTLLYKIIPSNYFIDEFEKSYLYFQRVDRYKDFLDSDLPEKSRKKAELMQYESDPTFNEAKRADRQRSRTYACCFSTVYSRYLWDEYSNNDKNSICVVFDCYKLIDYLEEMHQASVVEIHEKQRRVENIFEIHYGLVNYIDHLEYDGHQINPIENCYLKDKGNCDRDKEFRITLNAMGIYKDYSLSDGEKFEFPDSIRLEFDFQNANSRGIIRQINLDENIDNDFLEKLKNLLGNTEVTKK